MVGRIGAIWGVLGVVALLVRSLIPLVHEALNALQGPLTPVHWVFVAIWVPFMAWTEGYRGFHTRFAPRTIARAVWLAENPTPLRIVCAPVFCTALMHVRRSTLIARVILITAIVGIILSVRLLPAPWRGLVDTGVVVGLGWGALSVLWFGLQALRGNAPQFDLSLPGTPAPPRKKRGRRGAEPAE